MKEFIYLNYGIKVNQVYFRKENYFFFINDQQIKIMELDSNEMILNYLFELTNYLYNNRININTFLINKIKKCYTIKNQKYIVLLKENNFADKITIEYIKQFSKIENNLLKYDFVNEWKAEVDYIEEKLMEYNKEYLIIQSSINYYIGLAENAISLLNSINIKDYDNNLTIGHKITYYDYDISHFDNPFCFIKTHSMYDVANYFKYNFYKNTINYEELDDILYENTDDNEKIILFANLLYPNYYLDSVVSILNAENLVLEKNIDSFVNMIKNYENFLLYCKIRLKNVNLVNLINWIDD